MIALANDHAGIALKEEIKKLLDQRGLEYKDFGTNTEASVDYPIYGEAVGKAVASGDCDRGIIICGTGIGISIAANKVPGVRAALCTDCFMAEMARRHNNANILALGARVLGGGLALKIVETFLDTEFEGGRHERRVDIISAIEEKYSK
ncbi:MAG: ribose 5-phosphate isomerase B [Clostridiales bacterium]|nr:ribose 5-phosphate isomerase B [Clostridiales bacterium]